jgi:hypothetical protein
MKRFSLRFFLGAIVIAMIVSVSCGQEDPCASKILRSEKVKLDAA